MTALINPVEHVLEAQQFNDVFLSELFQRAASIKQGRQPEKVLAGKRVCNIFYEPSTRTRYSFQVAAENLGAFVFNTENAKDFSSAAKGESIEDSIRIYSKHAAAIVLRHPQCGTARKAAAVSSCPIINAGDGKGEHPTQALLDVFTIHECLNRIDNLTITMVGDLTRGRTVHSLVYLLAREERKNNQFIFVSDENNKMESHILEYLKKRKCTYTETDNLTYGLQKANVIYATRSQKERTTPGEKIQTTFVITNENSKHMQEHAILLHPLPRNEEINPSVDASPHAKYFEQAENGPYVRTALFEMIAAHQQKKQWQKKQTTQETTPVLA